MRANRLERIGQFVRRWGADLMQSFCRANYSTAILPNFGRPFGPIIGRSSLIFIPAARNNPLGFGFFNATSS
jgi:hypothetical protein